MMPDPSPWDDIGVPTADYHVRQASGTSAVPCFWGRDSDGFCLLILELAGDHRTQFRANRTEVNGVRVDLRDGGPGGVQRLVLTLEQQVDRDLFSGLCHTLIVALNAATDSASGLAIALTHLRRWKAFFSGRGGQHLSSEEVRGLFAELVFLKELIERLPYAVAVDAWLGPERSHQDFIFGNAAVEIKSLSGRERSTVRISSEDQLQSLNDALFLRIYRLSSLPESPHARSLNEIVADIQAALASDAARGSFDRKLVAHRFAPLPEYDDPRLVVSEIRSYRIVEGFPRLIRAELNDALTKVSYEIKLEAIDTFLCANPDVFEVS